MKRANGIGSGVAMKVSVTLLVLALSAGAQMVSSHTPTIAAGNGPQSVAPQSAGQPVVRVNGAVLTDRDLAREIQAIFPYEKTHNGIPKSMEPEMRKGALEMIIFEELVYQEALRRKMTVPPERMKRAEAQFRKQFASEQEFQQVMQVEVHGSVPLMREKIRRALLIESLLKSEVTDKAKVTPAEALAYYKANPKKFSHGELFSLQTISIIPPENANPDVVKEAQKRAQDAAKEAKATKSYKDFGLLAERVSDDDWHVNMGDRKQVEAEKLPPPVLKVARAMKPGQVSDLIHLGPNYTLFRLNAHTPAGTTPFQEVKPKLTVDLQKQKTEQIRSAFDKRLRKTAKIEVL